MWYGSRFAIPFGPPVTSTVPSLNGKLIDVALVASVTKICKKKRVTIAR